MPDITIQDYDLVQENGNLVAKDANDNTVFTYNDTAGQWEFGTVSADSVSTEVLTDDRIYARAFDGADADMRLDNALSAAAPGDTLFLEAATYADNRTISKSLTLIGSSLDDSQTEISGTVTLSQGNQIFMRARLTGTIEVTNAPAVVKSLNAFNGAVTVDNANVIISNMSGGSVTFKSGVSGSIIDTSTSVSVTDNGTNTVGDIA